MEIIDTTKMLLVMILKAYSQGNLQNCWNKLSEELLQTIGLFKKLSGDRYARIIIETSRILILMYFIEIEKRR